jgi:HAMP domain-containing protein
MRDEAGQPLGVLFAALDLAWYNQLVSDAQLLEGGVLLVIDRSGMILVHRPDPARWVGRQVTGEPIIQTIFQEGEGTRRIVGLDGVERLFAFTPLSQEPNYGIYLAVGASSVAALADSNALLQRSLLALAFVLALALGAAWLGGEVFILQRVRALQEAAERLEAGDWTARTGIRYGQGEISQLARTFDQMTETLMLRERERSRRSKLNAAIATSLPSAW